ncbi:MAG: type II toxin-antitoxin system VapC family toxin [Syntrophobacteria bacterium]
MDRYLIDTDVLIDHLRGEKQALNFLKQIAAEGSFVSYSVIGKAEIYSGIQPEEEEAVSRLFKSMREVPVDGEVAELAGRYRKHFYASHGLLLPDALVAASAKKIEATLVTLNKKHFPMDDIVIRVPYRKYK